MAVAIRRRLARLVFVTGVLISTELVLASPVMAHGQGDRVDLPLPAWQLAWAAAFAVAISFAALGAFWAKPKLVAASTGTPLPSGIRTLAAPAVVAARIVGLVSFAFVLAVAWTGSIDSEANLAPVALFITFWVGVQIASLLFGDIWRACNPIWTLADIGAWVRSRVTNSPLSATSHGETSHWPAVLAILSFLWFELAYHSPGAPRSIAVYLSMYTAIMLMGASVFGRGWVRSAEGFGVLFSLLAAISPFFRDAEGGWRVRMPLAGVAVLDPRPGTVAFILTVLGSTTFDGFTRSSWWGDISNERVGWGLTVVSTIGLVLVIAVVGLAFGVAILAMGRITREPFAVLVDRFGPSLIPIVAAYAIAHYASSFVFEGQELLALLSDPFDSGADWFGTVDREVDIDLISTSSIAWVQTVSISIGHVLGVAMAHDRSIERWKNPLAMRSQYPMLAVMVSYTVAGLLLLLGA